MVFDAGDARLSDRMAAWQAIAEHMADLVVLDAETRCAAALSGLDNDPEPAVASLRIVRASGVAINAGSPRLGNRGSHP